MSYLTYLLGRVLRGPRARQQAADWQAMSRHEWGKCYLDCRWCTKERQQRMERWQP